MDCVTLHKKADRPYVKYCPVGFFAWFLAILRPERSYV